MEQSPFRSSSVSATLVCATMTAALLAIFLLGGHTSTPTPTPSPRPARSPVSGPGRLSPLNCSLFDAEAMLVAAEEELLELGVLLELKQVVPDLVHAHQAAAVDRRGVGG